MMTAQSGPPCACDLSNRSAQLSLFLSFLDAVQVHKLTQKNNKIKIKKREKKQQNEATLPRVARFVGYLCVVCVHDDDDDGSALHSDH